MNDRAASKIAAAMRQTANSGWWDGRGLTRYFESCRRIDYRRGVAILFTRDVGHHSSGWWKNPDYERCYHLSLSFFDPETSEARPRDVMATRRLIDAFYSFHKRWLWCEPPYSDDGKRSDVWHYRLFCDAGWNPIKPRGEVYGRELTEAGWLSFSDAQADMEAQRKYAIERMLNP